MFLEWKSTTYYIYIATTLWITMSIIAITILLIEFKTFYLFFYGDQETNLQEMQRMGSNSNVSKSGSGSNNSNPLSRSGSSRSKSGSAKSKTSTFNMTLIKNELLHLIPIFAYTFYVPMGINSVLYTWNIGIFIGCAQYHISVICYAFAKLCIYLVFIYRLYTIYSDSIFNYNTKLLIILSVIAVICTFCNVIWNILTTKGHSFNIDGYTYCGSTLFFPALLSTVIFDMSISFLCCYLFIRPLWKLNKLNNTTDTMSPESQKMQHLITKYAILTFIAVISTFVTLIFMGITKLTSAVAVDIIINCFCIMLFNKHYDHYYKILCCGAIKASTICLKNS